MDVFALAGTLGCFFGRVLLDPCISKDNSHLVRENSPKTHRLCSRRNWRAAVMQPATLASAWRVADTGSLLGAIIIEDVEQALMQQISSLDHCIVAVRSKMHGATRESVLVRFSPNSHLREGSIRRASAQVLVYLFRLFMLDLRSRNSVEPATRIDVNLKERCACGTSNKRFGGGGGDGGCRIGASSRCRRQHLRDESALLPAAISYR